ncbi:MAG: hypothetical protein QOD57_1415 [Actinomycetota bacterium]|nr:hypothetical protein [Actinomycetota bacterium]
MFAALGRLASDLQYDPPILDRDPEMYWLPYGCPVATAFPSEA